MSPEQTKTSFMRRAIKCLAVIFTVIYVILLPSTLSIGMLSLVIFDAKHFLTGLTIVFCTFLVPLSILASLCQIWSKYEKGLCRETLCYCMLPIVTTIVTYFITAVLVDFVK